MKKITLMGLLILSLSACNPPKSPEHSSQPAESKTAEQTQNIANADISEVKVEDAQYYEEDTPTEQINQITPLSDQPPVDLRLSQQFNEHAAKMGNGYYLQLDLSAIVDDVNILNVTVNRGNTCAPGFWYGNWRGHGPLKFGQSVRAHISCDFHAVKEVAVDTDVGTYTFNF